MSRTCSHSSRPKTQASKWISMGCSTTVSLAKDSNSNTLTRPITATSSSISMEYLNSSTMEISNSSSGKVTGTLMTTAMRSKTLTRMVNQGYLRRRSKTLSTLSLLSSMKRRSSRAAMGRAGTSHLRAKTRNKMQTRAPFAWKIFSLASRWRRWLARISSTPSAWTSGLSKS